jgi:fructokinase
MSFKVVGIGEVLWDLLPAGRQLGGAPANFAFHAKTLGAQAQLVSGVGKDDLGQAILRRFGELGIGVDAVQVDEQAPTGTASVVLKDGGVPHFIIQKNVAWDHIAVTGKTLAAVRETDAVCFGSLAQREPKAAAAIQQLVAAAPREALKVFDANLRQNFYTKELVEKSLGLANVLKLNDQELAILSHLFGLGPRRAQQIEQLASRFELRLVVLTCGGDGSLLYQAGKWSELSSAPIAIVDTVGAGDSFTAALVMGLLHEMPLEQIHRVASEVAGYVCSQPGATPLLPEYLRSKIAASSPANRAVRPGFVSSKTG